MKAHYWQLLQECSCTLCNFYQIESYHSSSSCNPVSMQINGTLILLYFKELTNRVRYQRYVLFEFSKEIYDSFSLFNLVCVNNKHYFHNVQRDAFKSTSCIHLTDTAAYHAWPAWTVADPGFPIGRGCERHGGTNSYVLKKSMLKWNNWELWGDASGGPCLCQCWTNEA